MLEGVACRARLLSRHQTATFEWMTPHVDLLMDSGVELLISSWRRGVRTMPSANYRRSSARRTAVDGFTLSWQPMKLRLHAVRSFVLFTPTRRPRQLREHRTPHRSGRNAYASRCL